ncbi:flagellar biosynthesis protein FlhF [Clostridium thermarum]|uniref:flagellar biosynthesis protein FlhF n=1 Tax=Clostridium thermarum TaxID=1716543 RepID=UPI001121F6A7|nr:flagellar biosynthesis protein FlhF [Clostridium thermarum]
MIIKRYLVSNMNEAMTRIRYELGIDAVIISQRKVRKPGLSGFFSGKLIEVTAAVDNSKKADKEAQNKKTDIEEGIDKLKELIKSQPAKVAVEKQVPPEENIVEQVKSASSDVEEKLLKEFAEMKSLLEGISAGNNKTTTARKTKLQTTLEAADINDKNVKKIISNIKNSKEETDENTKLRNAIKKYVTVSKSKMEGIVVLVGPTGVGKTTTIAKLAGKLSLVDKKKVGLITVDTYRIGAVEQLRTYADIMNIPFKVVITLKEMESAINSMKDCDVILVDTTGRSSKNSMQLSELRAFVEKTNSKNVNLVISCTTKEKDVDSIIEGFSILNYDNIIITKLDETTTYGSIINILDCAKKPLNFVTTGQNVPDDIKQLSADEVCKLVLGDETIC